MSCIQIIWVTLCVLLQQSTEEECYAISLNFGTEYYIYIKKDDDWNVSKHVANV
jgi:hypothetical protein